MARGCATCKHRVDLPHQEPMCGRPHYDGVSGKTKPLYKIDRYRATCRWQRDHLYADFERCAQHGEHWEPNAEAAADMERDAKDRMLRRATLRAARWRAAWAWAKIAAVAALVLYILIRLMIA